MFKNPLSIAVATAATIMLGACSVVGGEAAPEPKFTQISKSDPFEIRDYPQLVLVKTSMETDNDSFMRLFRYISGQNSGEREIAMTAPVLETQAGTEIAMTAPVLRSEEGGKTEMAFILTDNFTPETAPLPNDPAVTLATIPPRRVAVVNFSGRVDDEMAAEYTAQLQAWIEDQGLTATGPAELAQYNPPWTVPALRRNEILIPVSGS
ncbi:MAG: heme-binding protein [Pseudomonadota bacterium]